MKIPVLLAVATAMIASSVAPASAQTRYFAREILLRSKASTGSVNDPNAVQTDPNADQNGGGTTPAVVIKCGTRSYQYWATNYNNRPSSVVGRVGNGSTSEKMCQDYASAAGSPGVCGVSTASADPKNPSSGYLMMFYPGDTALKKDGPEFSGEYSIVCTKQ